MQALEKIREAELLLNEAEEILEKDGVGVCRSGEHAYTAKSAFHVHKFDGIQKLSEAVGKELVHPEYRIFYSEATRYDDFVIGFEWNDIFYYTLDPKYKREAETDVISD